MITAGGIEAAPVIATQHGLSPLPRMVATTELQTCDKF